MNLRASLYINDQARLLQVYSVLQETADHLVLKLAAFLFFSGHEPEIISSPEQHHALQGQDFAPDLLKTDMSGTVTLWIECGKTTLHKLDKVTKRYREARIIVLTAQPHEARQMTIALDKENIPRVEVWTFQEGEWARWRALVQDQNDIIGEASESAMNLVINNETFMTELRRIR